MLLIDTHADTLYALAMHPEQLPLVSADSLRRGGVSVQTLALYVGGSPRLADIRDAFARMFAVEEKLPSLGWKKLTDYRDAREGETAYILSVEGCDLLDGSLSLLAEWKVKGVRMATLCWNYENCLATPARMDQQAPLTPFGKQAVKEMLRLGITPDISHLNDRGIEDLMDLGAVPLASHSCCRALCFHPRNLTDRQLKALFRAGGYVGVNFYPRFLSDDGQADLETVCDHILHMMGLGGESQVGFGSDFDGIEYTPRGLDGPQDFPRLLDALSRRGLTEEEIAGLCGENLKAFYDRTDPRA